MYKSDVLLFIMLIIISISFSVITAIIVNDDINEFIGSGFTIQDVYVYCGSNPDVLITHRGDNCSNVMNNIYGENENFTRWRIDS